MRHLGVALLAGLGVCAAFALAPALRADTLDDDIKAMKVAEVAGNADECIAKINSLRAGRDTRAFVPIRDMASSKNDKIAIAAIHGIVDTWHEPEFFRWLVGKISDKDLSDPKSEHREVYICVVDSIGLYPPDKVKAALKPLADAVGRYMTTDGEFADRAIRVYGMVPDRFTVMQLLDWLNQASSGAGAASAKPHKDKAKKAILETLTALCGTDAGDAAAWKKWWDENGKTFKFPERVKPGASDTKGADPKSGAASGDPSALTEFKDDAFGWSVKRPEGDEWKFFTPDYKVPRVGLKCGEDGEMRARAYFCVHDPVKFEPHDLKAFAAWVENNAFKDEFPADGRISLPETRTAMLNGVEWTIVTCKGLAGGNKSGWGSMERRFYIVKMGAYLMYVDAYVRLATDPEEKDALWNCIESITLPPKK